MPISSKRCSVSWRLLFLLCTCSDLARGQIRYSVLEEQDRGTFVGNLAKDLGIDVIGLNSRGLKLMSRAQKQHFQVNMNNGVLLTSERIDREELCAESPSCKLNVELVIEHPLEMHRLEIEILDVNDNAPSFTENEIILNIFESALPGSAFSVGSATDPDIGTNAIQGYRLSHTEYFDILTQANSDKGKTTELALKQVLDRESQPIHTLTLTAFDGGDPNRSGSMNIVINVMDTNDNVPTFDRAVYNVKLYENVPIGTRVIQLNATDLDEGPNGEVGYFFNKRVPISLQNLFHIEETTGVITVRQNMDFEDTNVYEFSVDALDKGPYSVAGRCQVLIEIMDENDNAPDITLTSISTSIPEDARPGTVIALMIVSDRDSSINGQVVCSVPSALPFTLENPYNNHYSLIVKDPLDRESTEEYKVTVTAVDKGSPQLTSSTTLKVRVSDINDNKPKFTQPSYELYVMENNVPGTHVFTISATDLDAKENGYLTYSISANSTLDSFVSINSENGKVYALKSFDYEEIQHLQFEVHAKDAGVPSLSSSVTIHLFIQDLNDNAPTILQLQPQTSSFGIEVPSQSVDAGYLVSKIGAVDADSGYNAWLAYEAITPKEASLFKVGLSTGEVRISRPIRNHDASHHKLVIRVRDHGEPVLSSTVTLSIAFTDKDKEMQNEFMKHTEDEDPISDVNLYLVISIAFISFIFLVIVIIFVALRIHRSSTSMVECDQSSNADNRGSWYYTQNSSYKVCLGNATHNILLVSNQCSQRSEDSISKRRTMMSKEQTPQSVDDLLMMEENKVRCFYCVSYIFIVTSDSLLLTYN
ncbi:hypothetical protein NDU88_006435 [Pleurodeles waltl]|uniref:Cadherin domain-containing protein n=1 Tax=Pleurodeles waltl TaxID=8319 RepID=A0AAV7PRC0_PLEWA|nr:hypothetical protein NDU88_006435 [Pleurodeles waltl]